MRSPFRPSDNNNIHDKMTGGPRRSFFTQSQCILKPLWKCISLVGMRRCFRCLQTVNPRGYADTISHFHLREGQPPAIALTIDDGLSRGGATTSMAHHVFDLLAQYQAQATFFVCTDYLQLGQDDAIQRLLQEGHEMGNHLQADRLWYYPKLTEKEFRDELQGANRILDDLETRLGNRKDDHYVQNNNNSNNKKKPKATKTRWFRAPQGWMNAKMKKIVAEDATVQHVLGDCYCDDWCFAQDTDPLFANDSDDGDGDISNNYNHQDETDERISLRRQQLQTERVAAMKQVADIMLKQVRVGSVAILHMPEKGFRQGGLLALEFFLQGIQEKGWKCVNLTEMEQLCRLEQEEEITRQLDDSDSED